MVLKFNKCGPKTRFKHIFLDLIYFTKLKKLIVNQQMMGNKVFILNS